MTRDHPAYIRRALREASAAARRQPAAREYADLAAEAAARLDYDEALWRANDAHWASAIADAPWVYAPDK